MTSLMADSTDVRDLPNGFTAYAGYVGGLYNTWAALKGRFPHRLRVSIAINASEDAQCLDVERGDATPADVAGWLDRTQRRHPNVTLIIYTSASQVDAVRAAAGGRRYLIWSAHYTGSPHLCGHSTCGYPEAHATQFTDHGPNAGHYDQTIMSQRFADAIANGRPVLPPKPPVKAAAVPVVSLFVAQRAARHGWRLTSVLRWRQVVRIKAALKAEGCANYAAWMTKVGSPFHDGLPRRGSLTKLGAGRFRVTP